MENIGDGRMSEDAWVTWALSIYSSVWDPHPTDLLTEEEFRRKKGDLASELVSSLELGDEFSPSNDLRRLQAAFMTGPVELISEFEQEVVRLLKNEDVQLGREGENQVIDRHPAVRIGARAMIGAREAQDELERWRVHFGLPKSEGTVFFLRELTREANFQNLDREEVFERFNAWMIGP